MQDSDAIMQYFKDPIPTNYYNYYHPLENRNMKDV